MVIRTYVLLVLPVVSCFFLSPPFSPFELIRLLDLFHFVFSLRMPPPRSRSQLVSYACAKRRIRILIQVEVSARSVT